MTKKQYENLKIGDLITCYGGPNKNVIMRVTRKYFGFGGSNCFKVIKWSLLENLAEKLLILNWLIKEKGAKYGYN